MQIDPFFQVPLHSHGTSAGNIELPILLKEADATIALFVCERERVENQLEGTGMQPALVFGRHALVAICLYNFENSNIGPHRIALLAVPVWRRQGFRPISPWRELFAHADKRHMGFHMLSTMTDSKLCETSGRELWGFPHQMSHIDFHLNHSRLQCRVSNGAQTIMELSGTGFPMARIKSLDFNMFSVRQQELLRTLLVTRGHFNVQFPLGYRLRAGSTTYSLTRQLQELKLDGKHPLVLISSTDFQGRMQEGVAVEQLQASPMPAPHKPAHFLV